LDAPFTKNCANAYLRHLEETCLSSSSVNLRLIAIRKLATEASDNGQLDPHLAERIKHIKGRKRLGVRLGHWLSNDEAERLINTPSSRTLTGKRDRAMLAVLFGCGLRRSEVAALTFGKP
jgi:site-specific recombinase XerD